MKFNTMRVFAFFFAVALCLAIARPAEAQTHTWGKDGWCYQYDGARWVRTSYFRWTSTPNNWQVYYLYFNGQLLKQVDTRYPGWTVELPAASMHPSAQFTWWMLPSNPQQATASNIHFFEPASNQWWTLEQLLAAIAALSKPASGTSYVLADTAGVIGGREGTPNQNLLTIDSLAAEDALRRMNPQTQAQFLAAVGPMAGYYLVR